MDVETLREHLATLGVSEDCSDEALKQAYRDLVQIWHPDRFSGDVRLRLKAEEQVKRINAAYAALKHHRRDASPPRDDPPHEKHHQSTGNASDSLSSCGFCRQSLRVPAQARYLRCPSCGFVQDRYGQPRRDRADGHPGEDPNERKPAADQNWTWKHPKSHRPMVIGLATLAVFYLGLYLMTSRPAVAKPPSQSPVSRDGFNRLKSQNDFLQCKGYVTKTKRGLHLRHDESNPKTELFFKIAHCNATIPEDRRVYVLSICPLGSFCHLPGKLLPSNALSATAAKTDRMWDYFVTVSRQAP